MAGIEDGDNQVFVSETGFVARPPITSVKKDFKTILAKFAVTHHVK
ncbi:MAG TPA: hypothetical protein VE641_20340 [Chthoniobacterales bacterium]|nr:hypothetical protein [Chthoniobacterales bacterium]